MKNDITQNTDIRGLQFLKDKKLIILIVKTLDELEKYTNLLEKLVKKYKKHNKLPFEITPQEKHFRKNRETHFGNLYIDMNLKFPKKDY